MKIFAVNKDNDLFIDNTGNLATKSNIEALTQKLEHVVQALRGEMIHHSNRGLPYQDTVWTGHGNLRLFEAATRKALAQEEGVENVISLDIKKINGVLRYSSTVRTIYGDVRLGNG